MTQKFYKINEQCLQNIMEANRGLELIETRGESTMLIYKIRLLLSASLEQMQKDNSDEDTSEDSVQEEDILIDEPIDIPKQEKGG